MLTITSPPAAEPVSLAMAKAHLRVSFNDDDTYISALITAARQKCESHLNRIFVSTGYRQTLDGFPGQYSRFSPAMAGQASFGFGLGPLYGAIPERLLVGTGEPIVIAKARLQAVSLITYLDKTNTRVTLDPSKYNVEPGDGGRISPAYNVVWPSALVYPGSVQIDVTFGYGDATTVPLIVCQAILVVLGHMYENREEVSTIQTYQIPMGVRWMLAAEDWGCRP